MNRLEYREVLELAASFMDNDNFNLFIKDLDDSKIIKVE